MISCHRFALVMPAILLILGGCGEGGINKADPANERAVQMGEGIYAENCAKCHGGNLEGEPDWQVKRADGTLPAPPHNDNGHTWHHNDDLLFNYTKLGGSEILPKNIKSAMPAFAGTLSDEQIWAVLSFIKSKWSIEVQKNQSALNK
ncbi:MAG: c-type cytochrome [Rhodospirillaceae bacterium]|nr:c-type cytochrome [Rhodospirillaceae bacterium]